MEYDISNKTINMIRKHAHLRNKIVLEVGCGNGGKSSRLADGTQEYIGIDPDINAINIARQAHGNVDFRIGSGEAMPFSDDRFDLVLFTLSLHHQNSVLALKEAKRVLNTEGNLLILEPSITGEFQQFFHLFDDESHKIQTARRNLMQSDFVLEHQSVFDAIIRFEDKEDLCSYSFDRETFTPGDPSRILEKLDQLQPGASQRSPIMLLDTIDLYALS
jgi:ubiquinone/menaquinone biosynthesis C-methylase UbiE